MAFETPSQTPEPNPAERNADELPPNPETLESESGLNPEGVAEQIDTFSKKAVELNSGVMAGMSAAVEADAALFGPDAGDVLGRAGLAGEGDALMNEANGALEKFRNKIDAIRAKIGMMTLAGFVGTAPAAEMPQEPGIAESSPTVATKSVEIPVQPPLGSSESIPARDDHDTAPAAEIETGPAVAGANAFSETRSAISELGDARMPEKNVRNVAMKAGIILEEPSQGVETVAPMNESVGNHEADPGVESGVEESLPEFKTESEVFSYLRQKVNDSKENSLIYGIDDQGGIHIVELPTEEQSQKLFYDKFLMARKLREAQRGGIREFVFAHTHPMQTEETIRDIFPAAYQEELIARNREGGLNIPPSFPDMVSQAEEHWFDKYDAEPETLDFHSRRTLDAVVDEHGVWKYRVDFYHPYWESCRDALATEVLNSEKFRSLARDYKLSDSEAESLIRVSLVPDETISNRMMKDERYKKFTEALKPAVRLSVPREELGKYNEQQLAVMTASSSERQRAIEQYMKFCADRGIEVSFTPFPPEEK